MKIAVGCDHVGFEYKNEIISHLIEKGIEVIDFGTNNTERTDYPIYGESVQGLWREETAIREYLYAGQEWGFLLPLIR